MILATYSINSVNISIPDNFSKAPICDIGKVKNTRSIQIFEQMWKAYITNDIAKGKNTVELRNMMSRKNKINHYNHYQTETKTKNVTTIKKYQ